ncbi:tRNA dihydrouridine synthase [Maridesulfovibrio hydrothermalis]|uniref:tRNA-dihydrouridine synthase n=1 Tax=Maridesulfovibrio hydrothermalis AM13 = DSM 14728 TaxID=1121451 RepID=L0REU5_9BACT|nr:tRNA-dihydrouridine synthase family protein [Maridesulfovibrio hydrothermalis]CCO25279.1 tRNA-dihydrouridine synthase [Maridesulfovibrio hydrothermalis AM13 = DSM 14728]
MKLLPISPDKPWLAPLAGYSDLPFRMLCRKRGCAVACTEMVSVKGLKFDGKGTKALLATCPEDSPLVVQLFGGEPQDYSDTMPQLIDEGYSFFDLNSGCPVKKVLKTGGGSALHLDPERLIETASAMVKVAGEGKVGVKIRLGFMKDEDNYLEIAKRLEDIGAAWITMHPRYAKQMFSGEADWSKLAILKQNISIPVIGSGDLFTAEDGIECIRQTGIDGIMFARGALFDPAIFSRYLTLIDASACADLPDFDLGKTMEEHINMTRDFDGSNRSFRKIRSILPRYAKGMDGIRAVRARLSACEDWAELLNAAREVSTLTRERC